MVCPYCSADIEPIELNGKVFCSNCGLTIANNTPAMPPSDMSASTNGISAVSTESAEKVPFSVTPEPVDEEIPADVQEIPDIPRKLEVMVEETIPETVPEAAPFNPITEEAARDLDIKVANEVAKAPEIPTFESKISDLSIPTEEDFTSENLTAEVPVIREGEGSHVEITNPGNEKDTLEASEILLDILKGAKENDNYSSNVSEKFETDSSHNVRTINPLLEPEIPEKTETEKEDDIYVLPTEVKTGLTSKKIKQQPEARSLRPEAPIDPETEKKIEKLEQKIADAPEPIVDLTPKEAVNYDPDTIENHDIDPDDKKTEDIKQYFSTTTETNKKNTKEKRTRTKKEKKQIKKMVIIFLSVPLLVLLISLAAYYVYNRYKPENQQQRAQIQAGFTTKSPVYLPEGYSLFKSSYSDTTRTFLLEYRFTSDPTKTLSFKQVQFSDAQVFISNYLVTNNHTFIKKTLLGINFTEVDKTNLLWDKEGFVFVIETKNFTLSNELLYKMAESVE